MGRTTTPTENLAQCSTRIPLRHNLLPSGAERCEHREEELGKIFRQSYACSSWQNGTITCIRGRTDLDHGRRVGRQIVGSFSRCAGRNAEAPSRLLGRSHARANPGRPRRKIGDGSQPSMKAQGLGWSSIVVRNRVADEQEFRR